MPVVEYQDFTVGLPNATTVRPLGGQITLDETWSPYVQGSVTVPLPADLAPFDPRTSPVPRVTVTTTQRFSDSDEVSVFTTSFGSGTIAALSALYGASTVAAITAAHNREWTPAVFTRPTSRTFDLGIRSRTVATDRTLVLSLASDEAIMQDIAPLSGFGGDMGLPGAGGGVLDATTFESAIPAILTAAGLSPVIAEFAITGDISSFVDTFGIPGTPPQGIAWTPGQSAWDFANMLVQSVGGRLWCDESRSWHVTVLTPDYSTVVTISTGVSLTDFSDTISRDSDWYDGVVVTYNWTIPTGAAFTTENAPTTFTPYSRVWALERDLGKRKASFMPPTGAAAAILAAASNLGRSVPIRAVSDYTATPGAALALTLPSTTTLNGRISSVTWDFDTREMSITTRNIS